MTLHLLYISSCIAYNYYKIEVRKKRPDYLIANIWRSFWGLVFLVIANPNFDPLGNWFTIIQALPFAVFQITSFYLLFDLGLNISRGKKWNYRGAESGIFDTSPAWVYYSLKLLCLAGLICSLIILFQK